MHATEPNCERQAQTWKHKVRKAFAKREEPPRVKPVAGLVTGLVTALVWWLFHKADSWWGNGDGAVAGWHLLTMLWPFAVLAGVQKAFDRYLLGHLAGLASFLLFLWLAIQFIGWHVFDAWPLAGLDDEKAALQAWIRGIVH